MGLTTLAEVYERYSYHVGGGDKGTVHDYLPTYERHMTRRDNVTVCEIGVWFGHSIAMWNEYFTNSTVYGLDIVYGRLQFDLPNLITVDATNLEAVTAALGELTFDYVIDDGSHRVRDQVASFDVLWPRVKPGGCYFIEDIDGDAALETLQNHMAGLNLDCDLYDGRGPDRQWDELLLVVAK